MRQNGSPELSDSGDRVIAAARLYHLGKVRRLVTCGDPIPELNLDDNAAVATAQLWQELGIPEEDIVIGRGASTSEELAFLKEFLEEQVKAPSPNMLTPPHPNLLPQGGEGTVAEAKLLGEGTLRVGLCTSAWHMPRALRHAKKHGLDVVPVPADFWTDEQFEFTILSLVPSADALVGTHRAMLEYVAMGVGR